MNEVERLQRKDGAQFKCISRVRDESGVGHIFTFRCESKLYQEGCNFPALERHFDWNPTHWTRAGFLFWREDDAFYTNIPSPKAFNKRLGAKYAFYRAKGLLSDLEYAQLTTQYDFVVDKLGEFYHDMTEHVCYTLEADGSIPPVAKPAFLATVLSLYKFLPQDSLLELAFAIAADSRLPRFTPQDFIRIYANNGWAKYIRRRVSPTYSCPYDESQLPKAVASLWLKIDYIVFPPGLKSPIEHLTDADILERLE
jgi:hypothetical protein